MNMNANMRHESIERQTGAPCDEDGTSSPTQFFVYQFDKRSAGLGGMAFEEGEFSVRGRGSVQRYTQSWQFLV